jgi:hypothetical protein
MGRRRRKTRIETRKMRTMKMMRKRKEKRKRKRCSEGSVPGRSSVSAPVDGVPDRRPVQQFGQKGTTGMGHEGKQKNMNEM